MPHPLATSDFSAMCSVDMLHSNSRRVEFCIQKRPKKRTLNIHSHTYSLIHQFFIHWVLRQSTCCSYVPPVTIRSIQDWAGWWLMMKITVYAMSLSLCTKYRQMISNV